MDNVSSNKTTANYNIPFCLFNNNKTAGVTESMSTVTMSMGESFGIFIL